MSASYTKLKSGEWGIRVEGTVSSGDTVSVKKKDGTTKVEKVGKIIWTGNGVSLCTVGEKGTCTERAADAGYARGRTVRSDCCGYPCPVTGRRCSPSDPCHDCQ